METINAIYESREAMHRAIWDAGFRMETEWPHVDENGYSYMHQIWLNTAGQYIRVVLGCLNDEVVGTRHVRFIGDAAIHAPGFTWDRD